jgi:hypothetical protein
MATQVTVYLTSSDPREMLMPRAVQTHPVEHGHFRSPLETLDGLSW